MNDEKVVKIKVDKDLVFATANDILSFLNTIGCAKYGTEKASIEYLVFARNVFINVIGNFILNTTNYDIPHAQESNIEEVINDIKQFFTKVKPRKSIRDFQ